MTDGGRQTEIDQSPFRDEIRALLKEKGHQQEPTYADLSEKIEQRYGEEYTENQLRRYKNKHIDPDELMPPKEVQQEIEKKRETIDIAAKRQDLVDIQQNRMEQALETEEQMDGIILDQASDMIKLQDDLLSSLSEDYERLGILESTTDIEIDVTQVQGDPFGELIETTVAEELEADEDEHGDYKETSDEEIVVQADEEEDEEWSEDEELDKEPEEIDFDDLPDEE